jgi:hypothetical protein
LNSSLSDACGIIGEASQILWREAEGARFDP